jgi:predicted nucleic-acid-binding Zn-ribbon protein
MKKSNRCPKCHSTDIIANAEPLDRGESHITRTAKLATYSDPHAFLFKGQHSTTMSAWVCAECGFVEFYATEPQALKLWSP